ncbi:SDR family oxidoreductase [Nocardiopsis suaedae]|uniref:NAD(P)H-binding protein n=1 Tax=Nocardiopsis suaedae TaxID=3018444 RepID=A0ABT4TJN1_9ACTN|nr:NAD(P)H-binding protein [Nocardiopsis suaedae]MDA2804893.1 NAD(P)H-binding protein [Nocardiopsis suaedae]
MILVTGATGNIGRPLVRTLLREGAPVRALTRDAVRAAADGAVPGPAVAAEGDLERPTTLRAALDGVRALFLLPTGREDAPGVLRAAADAGVERVVAVSSLLAATHPSSAMGRAALRTERAVLGSRLAWTVLRPWEFASNTLAWAPAVRGTGVVAVPTAGVPSPVVDPGDIAAVAARALTEEGHGGRYYPLTGPEALTPYDKARAIGEAVGREVKFDATGGERGGRTPHGVCGYDAPAPAATVQEVAGRPARSFAEWAREHADAFR